MNSSTLLKLIFSLIVSMNGSYSSDGFNRMYSPKAVETCSSAFSTDGDCYLRLTHNKMARDKVQQAKTNKQTNQFHIVPPTVISYFLDTSYSDNVLT